MYCNIQLSSSLNKSSSSLCKSSLNGHRKSSPHVSSSSLLKSSLLGCLLALCKSLLNRSSSSLRSSGFCHCFTKLHSKNRCRFTNLCSTNHHRFANPRSSDFRYLIAIFASWIFQHRFANLRSTDLRCLFTNHCSTGIRRCFANLRSTNRRHLANLRSTNCRFSNLRSSGFFVASKIFALRFFVVGWKISSPLLRKSSPHGSSSSLRKFLPSFQQISSVVISQIFALQIFVMASQIFAQQNFCYR